MRLPLEVEVWDNPMVSGPVARWRDCEPFVENRRGVLIHRPKAVNVYTTSRRSKMHIAIHFYCGSGTTDCDKSQNVTFLAVPPEDSLLCAACEARAVMAGLPTTTSIAGRHVHVGKLKAIRTCCAEEATKS